MKNVDKALEILERNNIPTSVPNHKEEEFNMVPVGRAEFMTFGFYSMFGCYCHNPQHQYSFLIDEVGDIFKCGFGIWNYASVDEYINGDLIHIQIIFSNIIKNFCSQKIIKSGINFCPFIR